MDECFKLKIGLLVNLANLVNRQFTRQHDANNPHLLRYRNAFRAGQSHLSRRRVNGKIARDGSDQSSNTQILNQHRIDLCKSKPANNSLNLRKLGGERQRIQRDIPFTPRR